MRFVLDADSEILVGLPWTVEIRALDQYGNFAPAVQTVAELRASAEAGQNTSVTVTNGVGTLTFLSNATATYWFAVLSPASDSVDDSLQVTFQPRKHCTAFACVVYVCVCVCVQMCMFMCMCLGAFVHAQVCMRANVCW